MNAGAEYVLYRIIGALQDEEGIHPESLLTCLGALAGYACRHVYGDAPARPLSESPLSIWALVRRSVQKLGRPLPSFKNRIPRQHRARLPAVVYLKIVWPQILPIAQPFCRKPSQLPVLFGIAIQRALEVTQGLLNPTIGARIAMDCAVAMSKVALPGEIFATRADAPIAASPAPAPAPTGPALSPIEAVLKGIRAEPRRESPAGNRRDAAGTTAPNLWSRAMRRPVATVLSVAFLGVITVAGARWRAANEAPEPARIERKLQVAKVQDAPPSSSSSFNLPIPEAQASPAVQPRQESKPATAQPQALPDGDAPPPPNSVEAYEAKLNEQSQRQLDANATGDSEMVPIADFTPSTAQPPSSVPLDSLF